MRLVARAVLYVGACVVLVQAAIAAPQTSAATPVTFSQTIKPLICTVDIIDDGSTPSVNLSPAQCAKSPEAKELLAITRQQLGLE